MPRTIVEKIVSRLRNQGVLATLNLVGKNIVYRTKVLLNPDIQYIDQEFDKTHGTDTSKMMELRKLNIRSENVDEGVRYQATDQKQFFNIMNGLDIQHEDFVFIDFGCGKGKILLMASHFPFRKIIGVEFSKELCEIAKKNIAIYKSPSQKCQDIETVCMDAMYYPIPPLPVVCYFYHPFGESVLIKVLENIRKSFEKSRRKIVIVYLNPKLSNLMEASGFLKTVVAKDSYCIFESI